MRLFTTLISLTLLAQGEPLLTSWKMEDSRQYARIYQYQSDVDNQTSYTTWVHPRANGDQVLPAYAGVHEVSYDDDFAYIRSTGMGAHNMGPWWADRNASTDDSDIFVNWPGSIELIVTIPRLADISSPNIPSTRTDTIGGAVGLFVDGVSMYDSRDAYSWDSDTDQDEEPNSNAAVEGDGYWERDAYVNEGQTFDAAMAHAANEQYHYHANPPALRHRLGDSVNYNAATNVYTEADLTVYPHSPILGWVRDGLPIYGPYGYSDSSDPNSPVRRMRTGFRPREDLAQDGDARDSYAAWSLRHKDIPALPVDQSGPDISANFPRGHYLQDYEYLGDIEKSAGVYHTIGVDFDLDEFNTRFCVTPEFPNGVRAYFVSIEEDGTPKFPYNIGRQYYGDPTGSTYINSDARAGNDSPTFTGLTVYAEGGPESNILDANIQTDENTDEVILTWSAVEGGSYKITTNTDLGTFDDLATAVSPAMVNGEMKVSLTDPNALPSDPRRFYRAELEDIAEFDDSGFQLTDPVAPLPTITLTLDGGPGDLSRLPVSVTIDGVEVEVVSRPATNQIIVYFDDTTLGGPANVVATYRNNTFTGTYTPIIAPVAESNVLFILVDDWGIDSSPIDNPAGTDLPSMDNFVALANESVRFENAYINPRCSPARMAVMSGRLASSTGVGAPGSTARNRDAASIMTIAEAMDASGVSHTSGLFGKWHLGDGTDASGQGPKADGWDVFYGSVVGNVSDYSNWERSDVDEVLVNRAGAAANETGYATTVNVDDALEFIDGNENWLCWVGFNAPHTPIHVPPLTLNGETYTDPVGTNREQYKAMLWAMDNEIGRLLDGVDLTTTTVILIGDNGTPSNLITDENLFPGSHGKTFIYEGGVRVPLLIRPAGGTAATVKTELVNGHDLFPTMCELMAIAPSALGQDLDGISVLPIIEGTNTTDRYAVAETFGATNAADPDGRMIRKNQYKLNIHEDPLDATDVPLVEFFDLNDGLDEDPSNDLLRAGYTMTAGEQAAYDELVQYNDTLNTGETIQFSLTQ